MSYTKITNKKVLVTGAAGFIGSNLVQDLLRNNNLVTGLDNFSTGFNENLAPFLEDENFNFIEGDIRNFDDCMKACDGIDIILHEAALGSVPRSIKDPITTNAVNVDGFLNMLIAARDCGVKRFIYASSSSVYGDSQESPKIESRIGNVLSPYAASKLTNEVYAKVFGLNYGIETIGLRYFNVFGPKQSPKGEYAAVIPKFINALLEKKSPEIYGDGTNSRDFTFIDNVIQMNHLAATTDQSSNIGEVFNTAVGASITLNELVEKLNQLFISKDINSSPNPVGYKDKREGDIPHSLANIDKSKENLGYQPETDFNGCLEQTVAWYLLHFQNVSL